MKRIIAILLAAVLATAMVACGNDDNKNNKSDNNNKSDKGNVSVEEAPVTETRVMTSEEFTQIIEVSMSPYTHDVSNDETMTAYVSCFNKTVEFHFFVFTDNTSAGAYYDELKNSLASKEIYSKNDGEYSVCKYEDETNGHMISKVDNTILYGIGKIAKNANLEDWFVGFEYLTEDDAKAILNSKAE